jgi:o-succinylbenzoate synthase
LSLCVDFEIHSLTYRESFRKNSSLENRQSIIVTVRGPNTTGIGESAPLPEWTEGPEECRKTLQSIRRQGSYSVDDFESVLDQIEDTPAARHGIHQALLDLKSKSKNQSIAEFLRPGVTNPTPIEVNDLIPGDPSLRQLIDSKQSGYRIVKIKIVPDNLDQLETFSFFDSESDGSGRLRIDFNETVNPSYDSDFLETLRSLPLDYVEQPFERTRLPLHADLRKQDITVALDESLSEFTVGEISRSNSADALVIKPMMAGGIDRAETLIEQSLENNLKPVLTTSLEGAVGRAGTTQLARAYSEELAACGLATGNHLRNDRNWEEDHLEEGYLQLPEGTGNGLPADLEGEFL